MADTLDKYVCSLEKSGLEQAQRELNEIPSERLSALKTFRDWIDGQQNWLKSPIDARFLITFLRNKKFVQLSTREKFINYWTCRTKYSSWLANLDIQDEKMEKIFKQGIFLGVPGHDSKGRKVCVFRWGLIDSSGKSYSPEELVKAFALFNEYILMEEQTQVGGLVVLDDHTNFGIGHSSFLGINLLSKMTTVITKAFPTRFDGIHAYNHNPVMEAMLVALKPFFKKKMFDRFCLHGPSLAPIYNHIDKTSLPVEYLPDEYKGPNAGSIQQIIDINLTDLRRPGVRDYLLKISNPCFGVNESKKPPSAELITESFRRLQTD